MRLIFDNKIITRELVESKLSSFTIGDITEIELRDSVYTLDRAAFSDFFNLKAIFGGKHVKLIEDECFANCTQFEGFLRNSYFSLPANVIVVGVRAFYNTALATCGITTKLTDVGIEAFMRSAISDIPQKACVHVIEDSAFCECNNLTCIVLDKNVEKVNTSAFYNCSNLRRVVIENGKQLRIESNAFEGIRDGCNFLVPTSTVLVNRSGFHEDKVHIIRKMR